MATEAEIASLRRLTAITLTTEPYTDEFLSDLLDADGMNKAALTLWKEKAAAAAELVSVTEGSSSRQLQQRYDQALKMVEFYTGLVAEEAVVLVRGARTRAIERA